MIYLKRSTEREPCAWSWINNVAVAKSWKLPRRTASWSCAGEKFMNGIENKRRNFQQEIQWSNIDQVHKIKQHDEWSRADSSGARSDEKTSRKSARRVEEVKLAIKMAECSHSTGATHYHHEVCRESRGAEPRPKSAALVGMTQLLLRLGFKFAQSGGVELAPFDQSSLKWEEEIKAYWNRKHGVCVWHWLRVCREAKSYSYRAEVVEEWKVVLYSFSRSKGRALDNLGLFLFKSPPHERLAIVQRRSIQRLACWSGPRVALLFSFI